jgi:hypothetical protein
LSVKDFLVLIPLFGSVLAMTWEVGSFIPIVTDCEWKAADRYDDGRHTVSELTQQVVGVCAVELTKAALAFGLSPNDPQIELDQFKQAVENVESARKARAKRR